MSDKQSNAGQDGDEAVEFEDLPDDLDYSTAPKRLSIFWKIGIAFAVVAAALAAAGIGGAIVRITCESDCALPYAGGIGLGLVFGGFGTLILAVLVARSMQEWTEWHERRRAESEVGDGYPD